MMLNFRRLMLLRDLAELGTITAVAERRSITTSAVSAQLRVLEDEVDAVLFRRDGRTLRLTHSGDVLLEEARKILRVVDEALTAVAATRDLSAGRVSISGFETSIGSFAAPLLQRLGQEAPELQIRVLQADTPTSLRSVRQGDIDIALASRLHFRPSEGLAGLHSLHLGDDPIVLIAPRRLHLQIRTNGLSALADESWITGPPDTGLSATLDRLGEQAGFVPQVKHRVTGAPNVCHLAASGVGVAVVPLLSVPPSLVHMIVRDLDLGGRSIDVVHREGALRNPAVSLVVRTLRALAEERLAGTGVDFARGGLGAAS
ncbi:LysR family transcriptional regulator [Rhodococcus sp. NPDC003318]|uniref:LysR family transcriptional regulator n=1 Tax=Rhodococcus sp. NPDC003318 TaxID=3364503 RepID=UPI00367979AB